MSLNSISAKSPSLHAVTKPSPRTVDASDAIAAEPPHRRTPSEMTATSIPSEMRRMPTKLAICASSPFLKTRRTKRRGCCALRSTFPRTASAITAIARTTSWTIISFPMRLRSSRSSGTRCGSCRSRRRRSCIFSIRRAIPAPKLRRCSAKTRRPSVRC